MVMMMRDLELQGHLGNKDVPRVATLQWFH